MESIHIRAFYSECYNEGSFLSLSIPESGKNLISLLNGHIPCDEVAVIQCYTAMNGQTKSAFNAEIALFHEIGETTRKIHTIHEGSQGSCGVGIIQEVLVPSHHREKTIPPVMPEEGTTHIPDTCRVPGHDVSFVPFFFRLTR